MRGVKQDYHEKHERHETVSFVDSKNVWGETMKEGQAGGGP